MGWESGYHNGVRCEACGKAVCVHCHPDYVKMDDCLGPPAPKAITNAAHIRTMSDEELAEFLCCIEWRLTEYKACLDWLQQPAEEV